ncbi:MAG: zf-HC2 domain-containing protein [Acidobacteria bacterium]|jgi:tetratricopeptide (TPR) repeat protein|nr:zf-HC2 domain-containing protein [Acidobacteriota bacterium]
MKCHEFQGLITAYLGETIEESRREQFEEHFFACRQCFLGLKINESLRNKGARIQLNDPPRLFTFKVLRPLLAMAALFLLVLFSALLVQRDRRAGQLRELARFDLPLYHQGEMRGEAESARGWEEQFSLAMRHYQDRDFRAALDLFEGPVLSAAALPKAAFFRAICYLETDQLAGAEAIFDAIIRDMNPAYFDEALYYKGFIRLRQGRLPEARAQFAKLAGMLSPMAGKARDMIRKIDEL